MNRERFIDKLKDLYYRDKNCLEELITAYDEKDKEIERLNNIINEIENDLYDRYYGRGKYHLSTDIIDIEIFHRRIKEIKGENLLVLGSDKEWVV